MEIGRALIVVGAILLIVGLILTYFPFFRVGRLPGDILVRRGNWSFYVPLATSLILSLLLTLVLWILFSLRK